MRKKEIPSRFCYVCFVVVRIGCCYHLPELLPCTVMLYAMFKAEPTKVVLRAPATFKAATEAGW